MTTSFFDTDEIKKIRKGHYSDLYLNRTKNILAKETNLQVATMQIFQKNNDSIFCGLNEIKELLQKCSGYFYKSKWIDKSDSVKLRSVKEGEIIMSGESVVHITGPYAYFSHLETIFLGILSRRTLVATNVYKVIKTAGKKEVIFFAARSDYFKNQQGDGYAAHIGGIKKVCTQAHVQWWDGMAVGTIPHSLIAINNGNTVNAAKQFSKHYPDILLICLCDFDNDCVLTSLDVARSLGKRLYGVRIDTAENMTDKIFTKEKNSFKGVNVELVKRVRRSLDQNGFSYVKIIVSGGFTTDKIKLFEKSQAPVDVYGVGSSLLKGNNDFTADIVRVGKKNIAKVGRIYKLNKKMSNIPL